MFEEKHIRLVDGSGRSGSLLQFINGADVVDVRVRANDLFQREPVLFELRDDSIRRSPPGSITMASRLVSSPRMVQLH